MNETEEEKCPICNHLNSSSKYKVMMKCEECGKVWKKAKYRKQTTKNKRRWGNQFKDKLTIVDFPEIIKFLKKNDAVISEILFLELLNSETIKFGDLTNKYVEYLEVKEKVNKAKLNLFAQSLATKYQSNKKESYLCARDSILIEPYVPTEFVDKYIPKTSIEELQRQKKFLDSEFSSKNKTKGRYYG